MTSGIGLLLLSWIIPTAGLKEVVAVLGVILFLLPIVNNLFGGNLGEARSEKTWRGRTVEPEDTSWGDLRARVEDSARDWKRRFRRRR